MDTLYLGIDIGSTTTKLVVIDPGGNLLDHHYVRSHGRPRHALLEVYRTVPERFPGARILGAGITGSGGGPIASVIGGVHVNELVAQSRSTGEYYPEARTVIEIGGQDSKLLSLEWDKRSGQMVLLDFAMNALCAAGTGSFLDQQAERLGISIDSDFARIALQSTNPARIAGRCTVFAKSDMVHLQQQGTPLSDILAGLCFALARNFKTIIGKGKSFAAPILFQGGVASNEAVRWAFESVLGCRPGELIVPAHHCLMAALGAAFIVKDEFGRGKTYPFHGFEALEDSIRITVPEKSLPTLEGVRSNGRQKLPYPSGNGTSPKRAYLGIDVGSISTCLALIDEKNNLLAGRYLMTAGRPLEAVRQGLTEISQEIGTSFVVAGAGTTGSGRYLIGHFIGADVVRNEITAQARAAAAFHPEVDTIFEIGGQDSKYIRMHHGAVVDFTMNNACAAGTGSFLEEQADRLGVSLSDEFAHLACSACAPVSMGERCTVFIESDLIHHQQKGASVPDLAAGVAYSVVQNYLNRVVENREVGHQILFQGGVASNNSVVAAFEKVLGRPVTVTPHHKLTGAIGAAILAREALQQRGVEASTQFRGFDLDRREYTTHVFVCKACPNLCEVKKVTIEGLAPAFYGARCDLFEEAGVGKVRVSAGLPDLFAEREQMLLDGYIEPDLRKNGRMRVGIPRTLIFHDLFPFWQGFFKKLNFEVCASPVTNPEIVLDTQSHAISECCFPVRLMFGHALALIKQGVDYLFMPAVMDRENPGPGQPNNKYCPLIPAAGQMVAAHLRKEHSDVHTITLPFNMEQPLAFKRQIARLASELCVSQRAGLKAMQAGFQAQERFYEKLRLRGKEILSSLAQDQPAVVLVGRPYNTCDPGVCLDLPRTLRKLGVLAIPIDFLPVDATDVTDDHPNMYWRCGQDILAAARLIRDDDRLQAIYVTSFNCGPDSFIVSYFRRLMGSKPFLELEVDDHTAEAGLVTRCEAFLDSLNLKAQPAGNDPWSKRG